MPPLKDGEYGALLRIGERIARARERRGMTQHDLGKRVQRRQNIISQWEHGKRRPGFRDIWSLASALEVSVEALVGPPRENEFG